MPEDELNHEDCKDDENDLLLTFEKDETPNDPNEGVELSVSEIEQDESSTSDDTASEETESKSREQEQYEALPETHPHAEKIHEICGMKEIDVETDIIEIAPLAKVRTDDNGDRYIQDKKGLIRYYLGESDGMAVVTTEKYEEAYQIANESKQRDTDFAQMMRTA
jgi:hypothetical protein